MNDLNLKSTNFGCSMFMSILDRFKKVYNLKARTLPEEGCSKNTGQSIIFVDVQFMQSGNY